MGRGAVAFLSAGVREQLANAGVAGARAKDSATVSKVAGGSKQEGNAATEDGTPAEPGPDGPSLRDAEDRTTASSPASVSSGRGRGGGIGGKVRSTVDRLYGYGTRTSNAFLHEKIPTKTIDVKHTRRAICALRTFFCFCFFFKYEYIVILHEGNCF